MTWIPFTFFTGATSHNTMNYVDTMQLLSRCQEGDSPSLESLVGTYQPIVYRLGYFHPG